MFRVISLLIWIILITIPLVWFFNNNGLISIIWLGFEIKIDVLTCLLLFILSLTIIFLIYRFYSFIISIFLGIFGIFKVNELKKRDKEIKKYETLVDCIQNYVKAINAKEIKEAQSWQKKIYSLIKNDELKQALLSQIENIRKSL